MAKGPQMWPVVTGAAYVICDRNNLRAPELSVVSDGQREQGARIYASAGHHGDPSRSGRLASDRLLQLRAKRADEVSWVQVEPLSDVHGPRRGPCVSALVDVHDGVQRNALDALKWRWAIESWVEEG
jgi:hypothetical protein